MQEVELIHIEKVKVALAPIRNKKSKSCGDGSPTCNSNQ